MNFNIIGAGRLGKNIALSLCANQMASLDSILNSNSHSSRKACKEIGSGRAINNIEELVPADLTWITCNDDDIQTTVALLAKHALLKPKSLVIHCSGVLNSSVLTSLKAQGCFIASFHPLKAFKAGYLDVAAFNKVSCVLEGDDEACTWLTQVFASLGAQIISLNPEAKAVYHAAACMASNYLITLASCSEELLLNAGISRDISREMICQLMQGNLNNLTTSSMISEALTGPLMRGDNKTISMHLQAIQNPLIKELYKVAGLATLPLTQLSEENKNVLVKLLEE